MKVTGLGLTASLAHFLAIKSIEVIYPGSFYPVEVLVLIVVIFRTYQTERLICIQCTCMHRCGGYVIFWHTDLSSFKKLTLKNTFSKRNSFRSSHVFLQLQMKSSTSLKLVPFPFFLVLSQEKTSTGEFPEIFLFQRDIFNWGTAEDSIYTLFLRSCFSREY